MVLFGKQTSLVVKTVKHLPAMQETQVRSLCRKDPWRRKWQPTPVSLPGESHGRRSLVGYSPRGHKESDTTERLLTLLYYGTTCHDLSFLNVEL